MTNIEDLFPTPVMIPVNGKDVPVQALSLEQVTLLLASYKYDILMAFADSASGEINFPALVGTTPALVSEVIAYGLGYGLEAAPRLRALPMQTQLDILAKVWELTAPEPKKLYGLLFGVMAGLQNAGLPVSPEMVASPTSQGEEVPATPVSSATPEAPAQASTESSPA